MENPQAEKRREIVIDLRVIILVALAALFAVLLARPLLSRSHSAVRAAEEGAPVTAPGGTAPLASASAGGVDIDVEDVQRAGGKTLVAVRMNNHRYDLSDPAIAGRTTLAGVSAERFEAPESAMGGHHVSGEFWFDGELEGVLAVGVTDDLTVEVGPL